MFDGDGMEQDFWFALLAPRSPVRPFSNCQPDVRSFRLVKYHRRRVKQVLGQGDEAPPATRQDCGGAHLLGPGNL